MSNMNANNNLESDSELHFRDKSVPNRYASGIKSHIIFLPFIILIFATYAIYLVIVTPSTTELIPIIPGSVIIDVIILLILMPIIGYLLIWFSPTIAMVYFKIYRRIFGKSRLLYLDMKAQLGKWTISDVSKRAITPGLLICVLSQVIVNSTGANMWAIGGVPNNMILALFNAAFIAFPIVILLLVPLWLLYDSGVMSKTDPEKALKRRSPETVETVHKFYISKFKGFGIISFLANLISLIIQTIFLSLTPLIILFVVLVPFLGIALIIPAQIIHEKQLPLMTKKIHESTMLHKSKLSLITTDECPACSRK